MKPATLAAIGLLALAPASLVFAARFTLTLLGDAIPTWLRILTGVGGALSGLGLVVLVLVAHRDSPRPVPIYAGASLAFIGHYLVGPFLDGNAGGALVYAGTAVVIGNHATNNPLVWTAFTGGLFAVAGALVRDTQPTLGYAVGIAGTLTLAASALILGIVHARRARGSGPAAPIP